MTYLSWHHRILSDPDVYFGLDRDVWRHICWLVDIEKSVTMKWENGEWVRIEIIRGGTSVIEWVKKELYHMGYVILADELVRRWEFQHPSPTEVQDETNEREACERAMKQYREQLNRGACSQGRL